MSGSLAQTLVDLSVQFGDFLLRSGTRSQVYFNKYMFEAAPAVLRVLGERLAAVIPPQSEVLAGLELGGVPLAVAASMQTGLPLCFVRKARKPYGTCEIAEGALVRRKNVCVVEDVITTGGQVLDSVQQLRNEGAVVKHVVCVIFRGDASVLATFAAHGLSLTPLYTRAQLEPLIDAKKVQYGL